MSPAAFRPQGALKPDLLAEGIEAFAAEELNLSYHNEEIHKTIA